MDAGLQFHPCLIGVGSWVGVGWLGPSYLLFGSFRLGWYGALLSGLQLLVLCWFAWLDLGLWSGWARAGLAWALRCWAGLRWSWPCPLGGACGEGDLSGCAETSAGLDSTLG